MQAIIHTGDAKCGSSAIQASLFAAEQALLGRGILSHAPRPTAVRPHCNRGRSRPAGPAELAGVGRGLNRPVE